MRFKKCHRSRKATYAIFLNKTWNAIYSSWYLYFLIFLLLCQSLKLLTKSSYLLLKGILWSLTYIHVHTPALWNHTGLISGADAVVWRWMFGLYDLYYEFNLEVDLGWNDQMSWLSWHSWENQGVSPPGTYFWAHKGEENYLQRLAWVYQGQIMPDQHDCFL